MFDIHQIPAQKGRIAIVTGANAGIGYETALALAKKEMKVILACRNPEKAAAASEKIRLQVSQADLEILRLDLSKLSSVREFADMYLKKYGRLDLLINNAGIMVPPYSRTEDGFESQMGTNYFGHFLLTGLLLDQLNETPNARIVTLSSSAHKYFGINFKDLHWEKNYNALRAYGQSKLACLIYARELQHRLENAGFSTLSLAAHPGASNTDLPRYFPKTLYKTFLPVVSGLLNSPENAALPTLMAAFSKEVKGGEYFGPQGFMELYGPPGHAKTNILSRQQKHAPQLWELSEKLTGVRYF